MRALTVPVLALAVLLSATACASTAPPDDAAQPSAGVSASATTAPPSASPVPESSATRKDDTAKLDAPLSLVASGGIAGGSDTITVAVDGSWSRDRGQKPRIGKLSDGVIARLNELIGDARLAEGTATKPGSQCPDMIRYTLTVGDRTYLSGCDGMPNDVFEGIVSSLKEATST